MLSMKMITQGPDGYSSLEFKMAREIVINDVIEAIFDFFRMPKLLKS